MDVCGIGISTPPRWRAHDLFAGLGWQQPRCWEMDPLSYVAGRRMGGAVAGIDRSFDSSELVAAFPVLHERVEIGLALRSDDHVAQRLVGGLAGLTSKLGDTEIGRCLVII